MIWSLLFYSICSKTWDLLYYSTVITCGQLRLELMSGLGKIRARINVRIGEIMWK